MMQTYKSKIAKAREDVSKITVAQMKEISAIFEQSTNRLADQLKQLNDSSSDYKIKHAIREGVRLENQALQKHLNSAIVRSLNDSAVVPLKVQQDIMEDVSVAANLNLSKSYGNLYGAVQKNVVTDIVSGRLYADHKSLDNRIWDIGKSYENNVQNIITTGILEKKSAVDLARDLEEFVKDPAKRSSDWGKVYPTMKNTKVDYNAMRLARTAINHSYQTATIQGAQENPFVTGISWITADIHGRTCDLCRERAYTDQHGLGIGIFPKNEVPIDHPNGMCTMGVAMEKSISEIAEELKDWVDGAPNSMLDEYFDHMKAISGKELAPKTIKPKVEEPKYIKSKKKLDLKQTIKQLETQSKNYYKEAEVRYLNHAKKWQAIASEEEVDAVIKYTGSQYRRINGYLRGVGEYKDLDDKWLVLVENAVSALDKAVLPEDVVVRRGVGSKDLLRIILEDDFDYGNIPSGSRTRWISDNASAMEGMLTEDKGFFSTSPHKDGGFHNKNVNMIIHVPKGTRGIYVDDISMYPDEKEIILQAGYQYKIEKVEEPKSGFFDVFMSVIPDTQTKVEDLK